MRLNSEVKIVQIGKVNDFEVGKVITRENIKLLETHKMLPCSIHSRLNYLELEDNKSYPGLNEYEDLVNPKYKHLYKVEEKAEIGKVVLTPIYVMNIKNGQLEFIFNSKEKLTYSNYFRDLQNNVDDWAIGYIDSDELKIEVNVEDYAKVNVDLEDDHIYFILMQIKNNKNLDFRNLPFTEYDVALDVQKGRFKLEEINQDLLVNYNFE